MTPLLRARTTIYLLALAVPVAGWGQLFEPLRGQPARIATLLAMKDGDREDYHNFRERLERTYSTFDGDSDDPMSSFVRGDTDEEVESSIVRALDRMFEEDDDEPIRNESS